MEINRIKKSIKKWDSIRNSEMGLNFLTSGYGFKILRSEYDRLKKSTNQHEDHFYIYLGLVEFELVFYILPNLIEKITDGNSIITCHFTRNMNTDETPITDIIDTNFEYYSGSETKDIDKGEVFNRVMKWYTQNVSWHKKNLKDMNIVQYFTVPKKDLETLFDLDDVIKVLFFFGITSNADKNLYNYIELILCEEKASDEKTSDSNNGKSNITKIFMDVTTPVPPFSAKI